MCKGAAARAREESRKLLNGGKKPMTQKEREKLPAYAREPFQKQITRKQAVNGKLLEDIQMNRMLTGNNMSNASDIMYDPNFEACSNARDLGHVRTFGSQVGRLQLTIDHILQLGSQFCQLGIGTGGGGMQRNRIKLQTSKLDIQLYVLRKHHLTAQVGRKTTDHDETL